MTINSIIEQGNQKQMIPADVLKKLVDNLLVHHERDALRTGFIELIYELFQPTDIQLFSCGLRGIVAHRGQEIGDLLIRDRLNSDSIPMLLSHDKIILKTVEDADIQVIESVIDTSIDIYVPLMQGDSVGAILVVTQVSKDIIDDVLWQHVLAVYTHLNRMLYTAEVDPLTGLMNRMAFDRLLNRQAAEDSKVRQDGKGTFFALVDIDFFKKINDNFGHLYGDEVLILLSRAMSESFRSMDWLFRYGGEEFSIVLIDVTHEEAFRVLERFRHKIETMDFPQVGQVTVSIGFSLMVKMEPVSSMIDRADHALYYAKKHGRNQVLFYESLVAKGLLAEVEQDESDVELF